MSSTTARPAQKGETKVTIDGRTVTLGKHTMEPGTRQSRKGSYARQPVPAEPTSRGWVRL